MSSTRCETHELSSRVVGYNSIKQHASLTYGCILAQLTIAVARLAHRPHNRLLVGVPLAITTSQVRQLRRLRHIYLSIGIGVYVLFWPTVVFLFLAVSFGYWVLVIIPAMIWKSSATESHSPRQATVVGDCASRCRRSSCRCQDGGQLYLSW
jgi:hypothetical protein